MGNIFLASQFTYNLRGVGSQGQFGGEIGKATVKAPVPIDTKSEYKDSRPGNYDFLAHDGTILASGKPFQTSDYNMYERMVSYNQGTVAVTTTDVATNG